jgi:hypothetical protein
MFKGQALEKVKKHVVSVVVDDEFWLKNRIPCFKSSTDQLELPQQPASRASLEMGQHRSHLL